MNYEKGKTLAASKDVNDRLRIAEDGGSPPELLFFLSCDPEVCVRLAVAKNMSAPWEADHALAKDPSADVRRAITDKIILKLEADSVGALASAQKVWHKVVDVFDTLIDDTTAYVRRKAARTVAEDERFPHDMVLKLLSHEDLEIAVYTMQHAKNFTEDDLVRITQTANSLILQHMAERPDLTFKITQLIVERGDIPAIESLLENLSAPISDQTMRTVIKSARHNHTLQECLVNRPGLSQEMLKEVASVISSSLIRALVIKNNMDKAEAAGLLKSVQNRSDLHEIATAVHEVVTSVFFTEQAPDELAYKHYVERRLNEKMMLQAVEFRQEQYLISALALRSNVPKSLIHRAFKGKNAKLVICIIWRAGFSMHLAHEVQVHLMHMGTETIIPAEGQYFPYNPKVMQAELEQLSG